MNKHILLVDGMALLFRGYYATAYSRNFMYNEEGVPTNGVYQFLKYFLNATDTFKPTHVICCWDVGKKTFRTDIYDQYKMNRDAPPEELVPQFNLVKEVVDQFNVPNLSAVNFEADDIIGSLTHHFDGQHMTILTGDQDLLQLVRPNVQVALMKKGIGNYDVVTNDNIYEKRGLLPDQFVSFKAFTGDSADNYPGVKGIGEVTALKLIQTYGTIDEILQEIDALTPSLRKRIEEGLDMFYLSKQLAEIKCDLPVDIRLEDALYHINKEELIEQLKPFGLRRLRELEVES